MLGAQPVGVVSRQRGLPLRVQIGRRHGQNLLGDARHGGFADAVTVYVMHGDLILKAHPIRVRP
jgi:hypothetical protein